MQAFTLKTPLIKPNDNLATILLQAIKQHSLTLENNDIVAIASKALATTQARIAELSQITTSKKAETLAKKHSLEPQFTQIILQEADKIYGGVEKAILTLKDGFLTVNAGIDHKNSPKGYAALWPLNPQQSAEDLRDEIRQKTGKNVGTLIVDSDVAPLRMGTRGTALAAAGFKPVIDLRNKPDLYQKPLQITRHAVAEDLAATAHLLMGETNERTPFVLIRNAPTTSTEGKISLDVMQIPADRCVYAATFRISTAANFKTISP